jgi:hypothetical protein
MKINADITTMNRPPRFINIAPIALSLIAIVVSMVTLILSQLLPAKILVYPGEFAYIGTGTDNRLMVNLYLTFANNGAKPGVVRKVAFLIQPPGKSDGYLLQAAYFNRLDEKGNYTGDSPTGPIAVEGHQTASRQIRFISAMDKPGDYLPLLVRGEYRATVLVWTANDTQPTTTALFPFVLSDRNLEELSAQRLGERQVTIEILQKQFQDWNARALNQQEMRNLLGTLWGGP